MKRELIVHNEPKENESLRIPYDAVMLIIACCNQCDWSEASGGGGRVVCNHKGIMAERPYATGAEGEITREVDPSYIPSWCPLYKKPYNEVPMPTVGEGS